MTGTLKLKKTSSGKNYYYVILSYKDPITQKWKTKDIATGLTEKGNRRKAIKLIQVYLEDNAYLEQLSVNHDDIDPNKYRTVRLSGYVDRRKRVQYLRKHL